MSIENAGSVLGRMQTPRTLADLSERIDQDSRRTHHHTADGVWTQRIEEIHTRKFPCCEHKDHKEVPMKEADLDGRIFQHDCWRQATRPPFRRVGRDFNHNPYVRQLWT